MSAPVPTPEQMIATLEGLTKHELRSVIFLLADYEIPKIDAVVTAVKARSSYQAHLDKTSDPSFHAGVSNSSEHVS